MYESFFRLSRHPFAATPSAESYVATPPSEAARHTIARCIERAAGPVVVLGAAGTGKSQLLAKLAADFGKQFAIAHLSGARLRNTKALLQNILFELKLPYRDLSEGELRLNLLDRLEKGESKQQGLLLLVDEAHVLSAKLLDELRMMTNLVRGGEPRVRLVLAGDVRLEERLANPRLASFQQRLAARCYLAPLNGDETAAYVREQLTSCGAKDTDIVDDQTLQTIQRWTDGVPRLVNQLCDHALILATVSGERYLSAGRIDEAWADLQQLPSPERVSATTTQPGASIIEFGPLDDIEPIAHDPLAQLDRIERGLAAAQDEDFQPLSLQRSELELTFHGAHHPFGGVFTEEEVVIDRYASLEAAALRNRPRVSSSEGRAIATLLGKPTAQRQPLGVVRADAATTPSIKSEAYGDPFDPASDPVMPEPYPGVSTNEAQEHPELLVVDSIGDPRPAPASEPTGRVRRQEYRQLFARLRRGG